MNLTRFTDFALRTLIFVAIRREPMTSIERVSVAFDISKNHLLKVVNALAQHGWLKTTRGRKGGIALGMPADQIRIGDVVRAMEPGFDLLECFDAERDQCRISKACRLKGMLHRALRSFLDELDRHTLADLVVDREALESLLVGQGPGLPGITPNGTLPIHG